jgi:hypothetical protein
MYWQFNNPYTLESGQVGGFSASGNYPFWGVSDSQGRVVSPYFRPKPAIAYGLACDGPPPEYPYLDFDLCSTRASGWPTDKVPFLVEIDHTDDCVGCGSIEAAQTDLILETAGLNTSFSHARGEKYGWNHCTYKGTNFDPTYSCETGFGVPCDGLVSGIDLTSSYVGNTCSCIANQFDLMNIKLRGSNISAGWTTWNINNSYINVPDCAQDRLNDYFTPAPTVRSPGFSVYASFKLACEGAHDHLIPPDATGIIRNYLTLSQITGASNVLDVMYENAGCGHHFPSAASDLQLKASFVLVPSGNEQIFEIIPEPLIDSLKSLGVLNSPADVLSSLASNKVFGCNTYFSEYGCAGTNSYGQQAFFPCAACSNPTVETCDCPTVVCDECDTITFIPPEYQNPCVCNCNLQLMRKTLIDISGAKTLVYGTGTVCDFYGIETTGLVVAVSYSGEYGSIGPVYINSNTEIDFASTPVDLIADSACSWHTGPNMLATGVYYEFEEPHRERQGDLVCTTLIPSTCDGDCSHDQSAQAGSCGDPIPWSGDVNSGVSVNLRSCFPEVMVVNKIECTGDVFNLYVAREYHTRPRNWQHIVGGTPASSCKPKQIGSYRYPVGTGTVCVEIPFCTPSDSVTPAYYSEPEMSGTGIVSYRGVCNAHYSEGLHSNQDFILGEPPASGEDRLWNYFNLFYESGVPSNKYFPAIDLGDQTDNSPPPNPCGTGVVYSSTAIFDTGLYFTPANRLGVDWTNKFHSCLQDHAECGSDFYCNKMFFPRRKYVVGTKVSRFGALQLCTSNSSLVLGDWYTGYQDFETNEMPDIILEAENTRFINACDETAKTSITENVGLDDVIITVEDYLPLIGVNTSLFRYTSDTKSCSIVSDACHIMSLHSQSSIDASVGSPKTFLANNFSSMGYYLDKSAYSEQDNCLFNPFKILVDVECCESVLRRRDLLQDPPTLLEYVLDGVPSVACGGFIKPPPCTCNDSTCGGILGYYELAPQSVCVTLAKSRGIYAEVVGTGIVDYCTTPCDTCCAGPASGSANTATVRDSAPYYGYMTSSGGVAYEIGETIEPVGCSACDRAQPIAGAYTYCESGGQPFISDGNISVAAYKCGDYLYIPYPIETGCCPSRTLCSVLGNSWKLNIDECMIFNSASDSRGDHTEDYLNNCGCLDATRYVQCDSSVIHVTITEAM